MLLALVNLANFNYIIDVKKQNVGSDGLEWEEVKQVSPGECLFYSTAFPLSLDMERNRESDRESHETKDKEGRTMYRKIIMDWVYYDGESVPLDLVPDELKYDKDAEVDLDERNKRNR